MQQIQALSERLHALGYRIEHPFFPHEQALLTQTIFDSGLPEALERLLKTRQHRKVFLDLLKLGANIEDGPSRLFKVTA